jgi:RNA polymerase sigma-70 factor, ECF subfamily
MMPAVAREQPVDRAALDAAAFSDDLEAVLDPAYRLATLMLRDHAAAEDAVQEAAIKAWRKHDQLRGGPAAFRAWFLSIVANECRMTRRGRWWKVLPLFESSRTQGSPEEEIVSGSDVRAALMRLDERDRAAVFCFFYLDMPMEEVARVLGVSSSAARSRVYRAVQRLRPGIEPAEELV